jgi:hypothetical protein
METLEIHSEAPPMYDIDKDFKDGSSYGDVTFKYVKKLKFKLTMMIIIFH